jgi:von Willebrand factor type C domain
VWRSWHSACTAVGMSRLLSSLGVLVWLAASLGVVACGGAFRGETGNEGGSAPIAGSGGGGTSPGRKSCVYGGKTYVDGAVFDSTDGCNTCACTDGEVGCDAKACDDGCTYQGKHHAAGDAFPATDGCNTCRCEPGGQVSCTEIGCQTCQDAQADYGAAVEAALKCDPQAKGQCTEKLEQGLQCGCGLFVNGQNIDDIEAAKQAAAAYSALSCGGDVLCGACATPAAGYCSAAGVCETLWGEGGAACKVGGVIYPDGATGIPDPTSCNKCSCQDGKLSCTEMHCPTPCPTGSALSTQCALCGPTDGCLIVEHACLPTCSASADTCTQGFCSGGVCRDVCG